jgi:hypothetical protein
VSVTRFTEIITPPTSPASTATLNLVPMWPSQGIRGGEVPPTSGASALAATSALQLVGGEGPPLLGMAALGLPNGGTLAQAALNYHTLTGTAAAVGTQFDVYA